MPPKRSKLEQDWEAILAAENLTPDAGQVPAWHRASTKAAKAALGGAGAKTSVQLPADWSDDAEPDFAHRVMSTDLNREISKSINARLSDYVWREARWESFPEDHQRVMELYVVDGPMDAEIANQTGVAVASVIRILRLHRLLANVTLEEVEDTISQVRTTRRSALPVKSQLLWSALLGSLGALRRFEKKR